jgi:hypothetical protein
MPASDAGKPFSNNTLRRESSTSSRSALIVCGTSRPTTEHTRTRVFIKGFNRSVSQWRERSDAARRTSHYLERSRRGGSMKNRTTVLAGTFALICATQAAAAQTASRPRIAIIRTPAQQGPQAPTQPRNYGQSSIRPQTYSQGSMRQQTYSRSSIRPQVYGQSTRIGWIVPPPPVIPQQNRFPTAGFANGVPQVAAFYYVPTVVLTDGRVFANFNGTYEQVLRRCPVTSGTLPPGFATPACWVVDSYGRYQVVQGR